MIQKGTMDMTEAEGGEKEKKDEEMKVCKGIVNKSDTASYGQ
jgi:hypothetical protein